MIYVPMNTITLAAGIKYPAPVVKAYQAQQDAEATYVTTIRLLAEAENAHAAAIEKDRAAMEEAARNGTGAPKTTNAAQADRDREYADTVATQARDKLVNAASAMQDTLAAHAEEILPLAIKLSRDAAESFDGTMSSIRNQISDASQVMQNAAHSLNILRKHLPFMQYSINFVPPTVSLPIAQATGNLVQVADKIEAAFEEHKHPPVKEVKWPVAIGSSTPAEVASPA